MTSKLKSYATATSMLFVLPTLLLLFVPGPAAIVHAAAPAMGDWNINGPETETGKDIILSGNLTIGLGGTLTFDHVNLKMNCSFNAQFNITIKAGGRLIMRNSSVAPVDFLQRYRYNFEILGGGQAEIADSELVAIGEGNFTQPQTMGLYIESSGVKLINNRFTRTNIFYMAAAIIVGPLASPRIEGNDISGIYPTGIIFSMGSKSVVKGNIIKNNEKQCQHYYQKQQFRFHTFFPPSPDPKFAKANRV